MWKCPICNNEEKNEYICQKCGHDFRCDFFRSRTIQLVPASDVQDFHRRILEYNNAEQERKLAETKALLEMIKKEKEKKEKEERKGEADRKLQEEKRKKEIDKELKVKTLCKELLSEANIDEKTLNEGEKAYLLACCRSGRTTAEGYISHIKNTRSMNEYKKSTANLEKVNPTQNHDYIRKKMPKIFRFIAVFILLGMIGVVGASLLDGSGDDSHISSSYEYMDADTYNQLKEQWDVVLHTSKEALYKGDISYDTDALETIEEYWESWDYDAIVDPKTYDEENKFYAQCVYGYYNTTYFCCTDTEAENYTLRSLNFSYYGEEIIQNSMNVISPLPFNIQYGDSYYTVYEKMGLTEEMVSYGLNSIEYENDIIVNIFIDEPGSELPSISLYFEDYYFHYFFNEETYELESYYVDIYNAW